jgi:hypothetical protein
VRDLSLAEDHAILAVRVDEKWLLLDNRRLALLEDNELRQVEPLFALNREGVREFLPSALADARNAATPSSLNNADQ